MEAAKRGAGKITYVCPWCELNLTSEDAATVKEMYERHLRNRHKDIIHDKRKYN